ncbi:MAG: CRISPR-associated endonuclease Cas2 [Bacteroidales bacterium]|nr:CRISPR-associated endonuclease Cas2 [Bacteroidales bacterium]
MFVILTYDVNQKRVRKALSVCRRYLVHVQRSVFEGHITESKLEKLKRELRYKLNPTQDSVCIYKFESTAFAAKEVLGKYDSIENVI